MTNATLTLTIHRAAHEIGGNCIELALSNGERILLDAGLPLSATNVHLDELIPKTLDLTQPIHALLVSHPHQDHYGLLNALPQSWPIYCGSSAEKLIRITMGITQKQALTHTFYNWKNQVPFELGSFRITPLLTDHSAFDAYMLLIELAGKRILYTGDFRLHGRKSVLPISLMNRPDTHIDALIMEGTNLGGTKPAVTEKDLEADFNNLFQKTKGRVFVGWSAQNIDRTVSIYRACKRSGRTLVIDLYTAEILDALTDYTTLPKPGWPNLKVVISSGLRKVYEQTGRADFINKMANVGISAGSLKEHHEKWVIMVRKALIRDYEFKGVIPNNTDAWCWSQWKEYLTMDNGSPLQDWFEKNNCPATHIHTSGHASDSDLRMFAQKINPKMLIPIHGLNWDTHQENFPNIVRLPDGEPMQIF